MAKKRLNRDEETLLRFPPTEKTWLCQRPRSEVFDTGDGNRGRCDTPNSGRKVNCWLCGGRRSSSTSRPLWPIYVALCEAVGNLTPGKPWPARGSADPGGGTADPPKLKVVA
jgi:hypothetical protein